jgi:hypothetical protein
MKISEFRKGYNPKTKHIVIYSTAHGIEQGTILESPIIENKRYKLAIDSYVNLIPLVNVVSIVDTEIPW